MTSLIVLDGNKRKAKADEWEIFLENRIPELIRRMKEGTLDPAGVNFSIQQMIEGRVVAEETQPAPAIISPPAFYKTTNTDLFSLWIPKAEEFVKQHLGMEEVDLREMFTIPEWLLWKSVIPVFDPGTLTNTDGFELLKRLGLDPWQEVDVMKYSASQASGKPSLHLIQNSIRPDEDTMDLSPDQLVATKKTWLGQRGYMLAFGLHNFVAGEHLDPKTWTWFPENRLSSCEVAYGYWNPSYRLVEFYWRYCGHHYPCMGARLAISCPLSLSS